MQSLTRKRGAFLLLSVTLHDRFDPSRRGQRVESPRLPWSSVGLSQAGIVAGLTGGGDVRDRWLLHCRRRHQASSAPALAKEPPANLSAPTAEECFNRSRTPKQIPLHLVDAQLTQDRQFGFCLDAFGDNLTSRLLSEADKRGG